MVRYRRHVLQDAGRLLTGLRESFRANRQQHQELPGARTRLLAQGSHGSVQAIVP